MYGYVGNDPINYIDPNGLHLIIYWQQSTGKYIGYDSENPNVRLIQGQGYSGYRDAANDPERQDEEFKGPIPQGEYTIEEETNDIGPLSFPLTPDEGNKMFGRYNFYIHGANSQKDTPENPFSSSEGCPIMSNTQNYRGVPGDRTLISKYRSELGGAKLIVIQ